jgi:hypothetical protein
MLPIARRVRAYFAPVARASNTPAIFDPAKHGGFALESPPAPWISVGEVANFRRTSATRTHPLRAGAQGAAAAQFRAQLDARVECEFRQWGKLQMALASGAQHMNVLAADANAAPHPSGGTPLPAVAVLPGSTAQQIVLGVGAVDAFAAGDIVAVDCDYQQQTGYVGAGVPGAYVNDPEDVQWDANYIRRVTFNVGRVAQKTTTALVLAQPLIGGAPPATAAAQKVAAFLDREGGKFFQEWSALFVLEEESGGRVCFYYPRLQALRAQEAPLEQTFELAPALRGWGLRATFQCISYYDSNDNEEALCYRSYFAPAGAALY